MENELKNKVLKTNKKYNQIKSGDFLIIGVSGGPDSICLLHVLNELKEKLNIKICVAHINHMIRKEAIKEQKYVENFCKKLNIEFFSKKFDILEIAKKEKKGIEETGRKVRYEFFEEILKKVGANKIVTAHNNNDKVETIIMNILRGSGANGLKGIVAIRQGKYIRPLIEISREEIEKYCILNNLKPKHDKSNFENIYIRNKIRNKLIPYIKKEFNPNIINTINRFSDVITLQEEYINKQVELTYEKIKSRNLKDNENINKNIISLNLLKFNSLELVIKRKIILFAINEILNTTKGIEKVNIDDIIKLCNNNIGNKFLKPLSNIKILIKKGEIFFIEEV